MKKQDRAVAHALMVLTYASSKPRAGVEARDIAEAIGLSLRQTKRYLQALEGKGFLEMFGGFWRLGPKAAQIWPAAPRPRSAEATA